MQRFLHQKLSLLVGSFLVGFIFILLSVFSSFFPVSHTYADTNTFFPYGIFEDGGATNTPAAFETMIDSIQAKGLDTVLFTNSFNQYHLPLLDVSDRKGMNVIWGGPMGELQTQWFGSTASATIDSARSIIGPLVDQVKIHPSVRGYNLLDDTTLAVSEKMKLAVQVYQEHDATRAASPVYIGGNEKVFDTAQSNTFLTYYYPAKAIKNVCDWNFTSSTVNDFSINLRNISRNKPDATPFWTVLQTHGAYATTTTDPNVSPNTLRTPTPEEVSLQNWIALGEGSKGIFWFIYSTEDFWTGLKDNPTLFTKVGELAARTKPLTSLLLPLVKTNDYFTLSGTGNRYISTLVDPYTGKYYVVVANALCSGSQDVTVTSSVFTGNLHDVETGQTIAMGTPITLSAGDGKIFEVTNMTGSIPTPTPSPNLFPNPSFEIVSGNFPTSWGTQPSSVADSTITHAGSYSFKVSGPTDTLTYVNQQPNLKAGTLYTISYWIKSSTGMSLNGISFRLVSGTGNTNPAVVSQTTGSAFDWKQVTDTFYTPANYTNGRIDLMWNLATGETANIDDVLLCEGKNCLPKVVQMFTPTPTITPTLTPTPTPPSTDITTALNGYWKMDQLSWVGDCSTTSVKDSSGNTNHAKACPSGAAPTTTTGKFGNGGNFDGVDDYLMASPPKTNRKFVTLAGWVNFDDLDNQNNVNKYHELFGWQYEFQILFRSYTSEPGAGYFISVTGTTANGATNNLSAIYLLPTKLSGWHHVVATYDGSYTKLYLDGSQVASQTLADTGGIKNNNRNFTIGRQSDGGYNWDGKIDDVRYYDRALVSSEIQTLPAYTPSPSPLAYWDFEGGSSTTISDASGNGYVGNWGGTGVTRYATGKVGNSAIFNGIDDYISSVIPKTNRQFLTLEGWVNFDDPDNVNNVNKFHELFGWQYEFQVLFRSYTSEPGAGYFISVTGTTASGTTNNLSTIYLIPAKLSGWHHVAATYDGAFAKLYLDGNQVASQTLVDSGGIKNNNRNFTMGRQSDSGYNWDGKLDEIRYYNYARTQAQIQEDMASIAL